MTFLNLFSLMTKGYKIHLDSNKEIMWHKPKTKNTQALVYLTK